MDKLSFPTPEQNTDEWLEIGIIVAAQGLKGEVRVNSSSDFPERFEQPGLRWLQPPNAFQPQAVKLLKGHQIPGKNLYVVQLEGVENRNQAEELRGYKLLVAKSDRPQLAEGEYHVSDLINLEVFNQLTGEAIGIVIDIFAAGNDLLEVKLHQQPNIAGKNQKKQAKALIPFVKDIVPVVDLEAGRIEITPPPGLLEVNQG